MIPLSASAAAVYFRRRLNIGPAHPAGAHRIDTLILAVMTGKNHGWLTQAIKNVTLVTPRTGDAVLRGEPASREARKVG